MTILELNYWVALGAVFLQAASVVLVLAYLFQKNALSELIGNLAGRYGIVIGFVFSLFALVMSLVYSEYFGVEPCGLCWLSRVFMYPQVVLFGIALFTRDTKVALYSIWLSALGVVVSLYHHYIQMSGGHALPCPASGVADCAKRFIFEFGYVTFPLVGFSLFAFLIILMLFVMRRTR